MKKHLDRRDDEKVWNVMNEIKSKYITKDIPVSISLLAGWAMNRYKEGVKGAELKIVFEGRIWAFKFVENKKVIYQVSYPKLNDFKGEFSCLVDEDKFNKFYKSIGKTYKAKATAFQQKQIHKVSPITVTVKNFGEYRDINGSGYLLVAGEKIRMGKSRSRTSKLVKLLWHKDRFGQQIRLEYILPEISIKKDVKNGLLHKEATCRRERARIVRETIKEIQREFTKNDIKKFAFSVRDDACSVKLKIP